MIKTVIICVMLTYHPMADESYIETHDDFATIEECNSYGDEFLEESQYDPVVGEPPKGYKCVEIEAVDLENL